MKKFFILACLMIIGCENKPVQPTIIYAPAPPIPTPIVKIDPCTNAKSDVGCGGDDNKNCFFTTDDNHCVIVKKKPTRAELDKLEAESLSNFDALYCKKIRARVGHLVASANRYEQNPDFARGTNSVCLNRMRTDFENIDSLTKEVDSVGNKNRWRLGYSSRAMSMALSFAKDCLSCSDQKSNEISCKDMRELFSKANCDGP